VPGQTEAWFEALAQTVERAVGSGRVPGGQYHALLVDEAHDFEDAWLRIAARMVDPATRSLLVLYDDAQAIYRVQQARRRKFNFSSVGIEARGRTSVLRLNYRNTAEVLALALTCTQDLLGADAAQNLNTNNNPNDEDLMTRVAPASAGRRGPLPVLLHATHAQQEAELLAERLAQALAEGLPADEAAVICRTRQQMAPIAAALRRINLPVQAMHDQAFRRFDWHQPSIKLLTMHSAKGLEFGWVCIPGLQALPLRDESLDDALRLLYVAMTRATAQLVLSACGPGNDGAVLKRVKMALQAVAQQFSQG
jgi:superfamily I DNA/RNA helicase